MWEPDQKESWAPKNWCFRTVVLEKPLDSPLDCKEIKPINPKEINPEYSLEGWMLKLKLQYFGHLMQRAVSLAKNPDGEKDWRQKERGMTEDEIVGWDHWLNGHEFEQALLDGEKQGSLVCCSPCCGEKLDTTKWLNNNEVSLLMLIPITISNCMPLA